MKPADHYRRANDLMSQVEQEMALGTDAVDLSHAASARILRNLQVADVHAKLGQLSAALGDDHEFLSPNLRTRLVLTLDAPWGATLEQVQRAADDVLHQALKVAQALASHSSSGGIPGPAFQAVAEALSTRTRWESDDDLRTFAATDGP